MEEQEKGLSLNDMLFVALVRDFESMAMVGFGKLVDPVSQKAERNLDRAKVAIDMLGMLEQKTDGNLNDTEVALLRQVLTNLRLNYVDEVQKEKAAREEGGEGGSGEEAAEAVSSDEPAKMGGTGHGAVKESEEKAGAEASAGSGSGNVAEKKPEQKARGPKRGRKATEGRKPTRKRKTGGGKDGGEE